MADDVAILAFPNYADVDYYTPTFSGGLWSDDAPLENLQQRYLAYKARSLDCSTDSTQFTVDLQTLRDIRVVVIPKHNLSLASADVTATLTIYDLAMTEVYASTIDVYPIVYGYGVLPFEHPSWGTGRLTAEAARYFPSPILWVLPETVNGRYVKIEIVDTENTDLYVELTRLFISPGWQPTFNYAPGANFGIADPTIVTTSLGSADFYDDRLKRRTAAITFEHLPNDEAFGQAFQLMQRLGRKGQLFFIRDPSDTTNLAATSFLCTMTQLDALTAEVVSRQGVSFHLQEIVA